MKKTTINLLPLVFLWVLAPSYAQTVADDPSTAMTVEATDAVIAPDDSTTNPDVPGDSNYQQPEPPYAPDLPDTGGNYEGPIGVTGIFNGNVTTAGSYDPAGHSAHRTVEDIPPVPGSLGKYPLKLTRYYNSRQQYYGIGAIGLSPGWSHEYAWLLWGDGTQVISPHGNLSDFFCGPPVGVSEGWDDGNQGRHVGGTGTWRLADGGKVHFTGGGVDYIEDPYGLRTTINYENGLRTQVTEPGGRYLKFIYDPNVTDPDGGRLLTRVEVHGLGNATVTDWVKYSYTLVSAGVAGRYKMMLTRVDYSDSNPNNLNDNTHAHYTYRSDNVTETQSTHKMYPLLERCDDVRYDGPMRTIHYEYDNAGAHGAIINEKCPNVGVVSAITPNIGDTFMETRGDGPTRSFTYTHLGHCHGNECAPCDDYDINNPPQQMLDHYTDFEGHTTQLHYDSNWYIDSVTDANSHTTSYLRGPSPDAYPGPKGIGEILKITHSGGAHIDYTYYDEDPQHIGVISGHYLHSVTDERGEYLCDPAHTTTYRRNGNYRVYRIEYPQGANTPTSIEEFTYNNFGQVLTHRLKNNAYERFAYDSRGLLTDKWNPKQDVVPADTDPHTHYTYYTSGPWADRLKTMLLPANVSNQRASETYEYDRNVSGAACPGRGLVTKITHADGRYQSFGYNQFGNKMWEENELRQRTSYAYDDCSRVLSITKPLIGTETFNYLKPGTSSAYLHTTNSVYSHTSRSGIVTTNVYDPNWRKTLTTEASGRLNLTTGFGYDLVGNLTDVTDPRTKITHHGYDNRDRKTSTTEAYGIQGLAATTAWHYDLANNINRIDRPDGKQETKSYDVLNRATSHTVPRQVPGGNPINLTTHFYYNPSGTLQKIRDAKGHDTTFEYDPSDRRKKMTYHDNSYQSWTYDDAGNLASRRTVNNETQSFTYDTRNRKIGMSWSNGADSASFTYYADSKLWTATNANSTVTRAYDAAGRLTQDQQNVSGLGIKNVTYPLYDEEGKVKQISADGVYDYTFGYDAAGRFETISTAGSTKFKYVYDAASNETDRYTYLSGVTIDQIYARDSLNRMSSRVLKRNGQTFSTEAYTYDHMNRLTEANRDDVGDSFGYYWSGELWTAQYGGGVHMPYIEGQDPDLDTTDTVDPNANYQPPETEEPEPPPPPDDYSDLPGGGGQQPDLPGRSVAYYLDRAGNRTQLNDSVNGNATSTPNNINQYTTVTRCTITNGSEHEISVFKGPNDTQPVNYYYINDEHLKRASVGSNDYYLYYDALGRCVKRNLNNNNALTTYYIYDGEKPILEYSSSGIVGRNVYGKEVDEILMRTNPGVNSGQPFYYAQDHEGSVTHLLNSSGNKIETYKYDAFGAPTFYNASGTQITSTAYNNRFLFTGREYAATYRNTYIPAFSFYEYRARAYNPTLGRFMSEDPKLFDAGDYNLFRYCHNDPSDFTDPMGLDTMANAMAVAEAVVPGQYEYNQMVANFQSGNYGNAAGWGITWVASTYVGMASGGTSTRAQATFRAARVAAAEGKGYRYVNFREALKIFDNNGKIPMVNSQNKAKTLFYTNEKFTTGKAAHEGLELYERPTHRVQFNLADAPAGSGSLTGKGHVEFTLKEGAEPIRATRIDLLDDAASELELDLAPRNTPPHLTR
jgi:RHS repeat-associated protein